MLVTSVIIQKIFTEVTLLTEVTIVKSFLGMSSLVIIFVSAGFEALIAEYAFKRFFSSMLSEVDRQVTFLVESFTTCCDWTNKGERQCGVLVLVMFFQAPRRFKAFIAYRTNERISTA